MKSFIILLFTLTLNFYINAQENFNHTIYYQGFIRSFIVHLPPGFSDSIRLPVVFVLHGSNGSAALTQERYHYDNVADTANFIVCYPNGVNGWADGSCLTPPNVMGINDVGFFNKMIDFLKSNYNIDLNRVYAQGISNGGFMCEHLACEMSDKIAAIVIVAATSSNSLLQDCFPVRPVPIEIFHGTEDPTCPDQGGSIPVGSEYCNLYSTDSTVRFWTFTNGNCPSQPVITQIPSTGLTPETTVFKEYYGFCNDSSEVIFYNILGGTHRWPGIEYGPNNFGLTLDINATTEGWKFLKKFHLHKSIITGFSEEDRKSYFKLKSNLVTENLVIELHKKIADCNFQIINCIGQNLKSFQFKNVEESVSLPVNDLQNGMYLLRVELNELEFVEKFFVSDL